MSIVQASMPPQSATANVPPLWQRLRTNRNWIALWFMLPAAAFLILFLAYPLGLGIWMSFTDERIGRTGVFVGLENYQWLWDDSIFWLSVFNTLLYTIIASAIKFVIGLYLALLLNRHMPFKAIIRSIVLIPFIVPTVLSAIAFWWIYDAQFSIISWSLIKLGLIHHNIDFLGDANMARGSVIFANIWRGVPFVAITLLAGRRRSRFPGSAFSAGDGSKDRTMTDQVLPSKGPAAARDDDSDGMSYLESLPRRLVTLYLPLFVILVVLLFPFYWMGLTSIKPDEQLIDMDKFNPFWVIHPTFKHISKLLFETEYPRWLWNTMYVAVGATTLSIIASVLAAYAIVRLRFKGADAVGVLIFFAYLVPPSILFIPLASVIQAYGLFDSPVSLILVYPTLLIPFSTWLLMGYFKTIPYELEECALIDGASRWQILVKIVIPLAIPGLISAFIFSFTLCWNEFIYALTFLQSTQNKTVPVAIVNEFVDGDVYKWGSLMAGALVGSLPLVILYAFFVEHYVSAMTGAVKE